MPQMSTTTHDTVWNLLSWETGAAAVRITYPLASSQAEIAHALYLRETLIWVLEYIAYQIRLYDFMNAMNDMYV